MDVVKCYLRYGADFTNYCSFRFWEKSDAERNTYMTARRNYALRLEVSTPRVYQLFLDKAAFNLRFARYVHRAWLATGGGKSMDDVKAFLSSHERVIAKPLEDYGGHGVMALSQQDDDATRKQKRQTLLTAVRQGAGFILEETIENVDYIKRLAPGSLNTVRIVTMIDNQHELHIVAALLRMGSGVSVTDNFLAGGMACPIDVATGKLTKTAYGMNCAEYEIHPYSKIKFEGYPLPDFPKCMELIKALAFVEPEARFVGWDLAVTPSGIDLLEGNIPPGENIMQLATGKGIWQQLLVWK